MGRCSSHKKERDRLLHRGVLTIDEGLCVQIMHIGPYDTGSESVALMDAFLAENGYANDMADGRLHHEIYLSNQKECFGKDENGNPASDKTSLMILVAEKHKLEICGG